MGHTSQHISLTGVETAVRINLARHQSGGTGAALSLSAAVRKNEAVRFRRLEQRLPRKRSDSLTRLGKLDCSLGGPRIDSRTGAGLAGVEPLFQDVFRSDRGGQQDSFDVLHEKLRPTKEVRAAAQIIEMLPNQIATNPALFTAPSVIGLCQNHDPFQARKPFFQELEVRSKDDVLPRSHAIEESHFGVQAKVLNVAEHRHHWRNSGATGE